MCLEIIDARTIEVDGRKVTIEIVPDLDATPYDADCYSAEEVKAWELGDWVYVGVVITYAGNNASLWNVEYGTMPGADPITIDRLINEIYVIVDGEGFTLPECLFAEFDLIERGGK